MLKEIIKVCLLVGLGSSIFSFSASADQIKSNAWERVSIPQGFEIEKLIKGEDGKQYMLARLIDSRGVYSFYQYDNGWKEITRHDSCNDFAVDKNGNIYALYRMIKGGKIIKFTPHNNKWDDFFAVGHDYGIPSIDIKGDGLLFNAHNNTIRKHEVLMFNLMESNNGPSTVFSADYANGYVPQITIQSLTKVFISTLDYQTLKSDLFEYRYENKKWLFQNICKNVKTDASTMEASKNYLYFVANRASQAYRYDLTSGNCLPYKPLPEGTLLMSKIYVDKNEDVYFGGLEPNGHGGKFSAVYKVKSNELNLEKVGGRMINRDNQPEIAIIRGVSVLGNTIYASPISGVYHSLYKYEQK